MFQDRKILIATNHRKETVISPLLEQFGLKCELVENLPTDNLGTFSGEVERLTDSTTTLRNKCLLGLKVSDCDLVIASEGSFGAHPNLFFVQANEELVMLLDTKNDLEISAKFISTETNFDAKEIPSFLELTNFAEKALFPSHGLILRRSKSDYSEIYKGINDWQQLESIFNKLMKNHSSIYVETDMRAMFNPTRMKTIEKATEKLIEKMKSCCPSCQTPGFDVTELIAGLPCEWCERPTQSILKKIASCKKCDYKEEVLFPTGKKVESPEFCNHCNP
jgi:hypothetical protein